MNLVGDISVRSISQSVCCLLMSAVVLSGCRTISTAPNKTMSPAVVPAHELSIVPDSKAKVGGGYLAGDGPDVNAPANIDAVADAIPRDEPLHRYANRPYTALGQLYNPLTQTGNFKERGVASWYGKKFHGQRTSIGEIYDMYGMTAAHPTLPIPSYARVTNLSNHKSVVLRINDRGPFLRNRIVDLSYTAAYKLDLLGDGSSEVEIESIATNNNAMVNAAAQPTSVVVIANKPSSNLSLPATASKTGEVYLQLGAFGSKEGAESFIAKIRDDLAAYGKSLSLDKKNGLTRVQCGPYTTVSQARNASVALTQKLGLKPFVSIR